MVIVHDREYYPPNGEVTAVESASITPELPCQGLANETTLSYKQFGTIDGFDSARSRG